MAQQQNQKRQVLGEFLKSRRSFLQPEQVGLPPGARRRTPGLRREEVAQLAGIGLTWYTWLEQGREINVSDQVLDSLARVFLLTETERAHLYVLAGNSPPADAEKKQANIPSEPLLHLLASLNQSCSPAYLMDQRWQILAWNDCAARVFGDFSRWPEAERNVLHLMFCDEAYRSLFLDWEYHARGVIARFHATMALHLDDPWFTDFVAQLGRQSKEFSQWWSQYAVHDMFHVIKELKHPELGNLTFEFVSLDVSQNRNVKLLVHTPDEATTVTLRKSRFT